MLLPEIHRVHVIYYGQQMKVFSEDKRQKNAKEIRPKQIIPEQGASLHSALEL